MGTSENSLHVVTRFAPSPTGFMHIGGLRTALFAYLWAKKNGGTFILRIEDTDKAREVPGSIEHIEETLRWLGLEWDAGLGKERAPLQKQSLEKVLGSALDGPKAIERKPQPDSFLETVSASETDNFANDFFIGANKSGKQSERLETYREMAEKLIAKGLAYVDPYSAEEVEAFRKQAAAEKRPFLFRDHRPDEKHMHVPADWYGSRPLRFKVPVVKRYTWADAVRGELTAGEEALDDFILIKADGYPTYNFAHIVDDYHMRVTHVMRADEFISSTPKFLSLYDALEMSYPVFVTLPPILRADKTKKLGKRDGAKDVMEYQKEGYLVDAFTNFLALIGWNPGGDRELFSREELIAAFDIANIQKAGAVMNEEKLDWFNKEYLKKIWERVEGRREIEQELRTRVPASTRALGKFSEERLEKVLPLIFDRISVYADVEKVCSGYVEMKDDGRGGTIEVHVPSEVNFFFTAPILPHLMAAESKVREVAVGVEMHVLVPKKSTVAETREMLAHLAELAAAAPESAYQSVEGVKEIFWACAEEKGRGAVLWPLRVALSGLEKSPDPFTIAWVVGKEEVVKRLQSAVSVL